MGDLTPRRARAIARTAYIFAYPLVREYGDMYQQAVNMSSPTYSGGFGTWRHVMSRERRIGGARRPHETAVKSSVWLDLRSEPWCCEVGEVPADVHFTGRWVDLWGFLLESDTAAAHESCQGSVLAAAPVDVYDVPSEIDGIVRGESGFVVLLTETRWRDPHALPGVQPTQPEIVLEPASLHLGRRRPKSAPPVHWSPWRHGIETTDEFWSCANFALSLITPNRQDESVLDRIAEIGVVANRPPEVSVFSDEIVEAIQAGVDDALSDLMEAADEPGVCQPTYVHRSEMDRDYFSRAVRALCPLQ